MRSKSYRQQLLFYTLVSLASIILVVLIHEFINTRLIDKYDSAFSIYDEMSRFYDNQNQAHESLRNYLYTNESYIYDGSIKTKIARIKRLLLK